ncbi:dihydroorotate dehydrogenase electron transfer subunit [Anaeromicropila populeti]|uniref:Dihydroorotate dehydrogenase B (NAD(+)), electron transfer subunit n=1 Tax=Anaeromicropila populeti TaxID=37658 RepID=A0A1I6JCW2_9FIRM|nr:dihydroorotate dehydrogenase electron transfer subunit [Anaeromicropila populeti]SFR76853.1 dihydroorotate dehydrogenase electron transfer subunit [Anaeromicropila populeti]
MADKFRATALITSLIEIADGIYSMWIKEKEIASHAKAGQFVSLYCKAGQLLLPRPISICEIDPEGGTLRLVFRVAGSGTREFSLLQQGDFIDVFGPLGNGFMPMGKKAILIGGGIGIPPMLQLAKSLECEKTIVLGYRDKELFLKEEFELLGKVCVSTEDGSYGTKGNVINAITENKIDGDIIFACGPTPMLRGIKQFAQEKGIKAQLSLEEKMACGIGACLACVCQSERKDHHTNVNNKRVCKDGPVFFAEDITI